MQLRYHTPLSAQEQRAHGLTAPQPLALADRVRFAELDILNHVNNKAYVEWFETLRVAYVNNFCRPFFDGPEPRIVIRNANLHYVREMVQDEDYIVTARVTGFRQSSFTMEQQLWSGDLRARLEAVMVAMMPDGSGKYPLPARLTEQFIRRDGAQPG
ncbi:acyl-CoA thioesterase [Ruegeria sp. PrR005]|uniref:Acyl-CoA thioesterase n=1 Tax=Ruegeria sp. PrR005 TaxID=2706882 RepID=A0A6B2NJR5_9RHOB|nr:acyl-CoA thioesterase [Ruegeria sp. PrR005]NDW43400.1 acyl-CoA thioesterase [Ruegeria sp. PrR005]